MRFSVKVLPTCLVAMFLFGCAEQPQTKMDVKPNMEVKEAAKLPTKPGRKREPRVSIDSAKKEMLIRPTSD